MIEWMQKHMIFTMIIVFWLLWMVYSVTVKVFWDPVDIPTNTLTALGIVYGLPAVAIGLWKWRSSVMRGSKDDNSET